MGFEKLVDVLLQFVDLFRFWTISRAGNVIVIFTLGKVTRTLHPGKGWFKTGLFLKAPFNIEQDEQVSTREDNFVVSNQDLMTSDGRTVRVSGSFRLQILGDKADIWLTELGDENMATPSLCRAAIGETILRRTYEELMTKDELKDLRQEILDRARKELNRYGYKIWDFWWIERTSGKTYRLITGE
mgnify:CR=1 FL=1